MKKFFKNIIITIFFFCTIFISNIYGQNYTRDTACVNQIYQLSVHYPNAKGYMESDSIPTEILLCLYVNYAPTSDSASGFAFIKLRNTTKYTSYSNLPKEVTSIQFNLVRKGSSYCIYFPELTHLGCEDYIYNFAFMQNMQIPTSDLVQFINTKDGRCYSATFCFKKNLWNLIDESHQPSRISENYDLIGW